MERNRYVIDTNIWVSAIISGKFHELAAFLLETELEVITCKELVTELREVLSRKKFEKYLILPVEDYVNLHIRLCKDKKIRLIFADSPDPKDNYLFDLAFQHKASMLVTGDKKLLALNEKYAMLEIITLASFKQLIAALIKAMEE